MALSRENISQESILNFRYLKELALEEIQQLCQEEWTDYNDHDPGITLLESMIYGLSEVALKIDIPYQQLIGGEGHVLSKNLDTFHHPKELFSTSPITPNDFQKVLITIPGVRRVEFKDSKELPEINATSQIWIELETEDQDQSVIEGKIRKVLKDFPQLGHQFLGIHFFPFFYVSLQLKIDISIDSNAENIVGGVSEVVDEYIRPKIQFFSTDELLERGDASEDVYDGPIQEGERIDQEGMSKLKFRRDLRTSDLLNLIMDVPSVVSVQEIRILDQFDRSFLWAIKIPEGHAIRLNYQKSSVELHSNSGRIGTFPFLEGVQRTLKRGLVKDITQENVTPIEFAEKRREQPVESFVGIGQDLPSIYNLFGNGAVIDRYNAERNLQLAGYLYFFDYFIKGLLVQLSSIGSLFSLEAQTTTYHSVDPMELDFAPYLLNSVNKWINENGGRDNPTKRKSLWERAKMERKRLKEIIEFNVNSDTQDNWERLVSQYRYFGVYEEKEREYLEGKVHPRFLKFVQQFADIKESPGQFFDRRTRVLDHLLARFGRSLDAYFYPNQPEEEKIQVKRRFLKDIRENGAWRAIGVNPKSEVSGLEKIIRDIFVFEEVEPGFVSLAQDKFELLPGVANRNAQVQFLFEDKSINRVFRHLFSYGVNEKYYQKTKRDIFLKDEEQENFGVIEDGTYKGLEIKELIDFFMRLDMEFQNFYFVDHGNLLPDLNGSSFGLVFRDFKGKKICFTNPVLSKEERLDLLDEVVLKIIQSDFPKVSEIGGSQFVLDFGIQGSKFTQFYHSKEDALQEKVIFQENFQLALSEFFERDSLLEDFKKIDYFKSNHKDLVDIIQNIMEDKVFLKKSDHNFVLCLGKKSNPSYQYKINFESIEGLEKFQVFLKNQLKKRLREFGIKWSCIDFSNDFINDLKDEDPFSFRVSFVLPDWPFKFQDPRFRKQFFSAVLNESPAHVIPQVHWLPFTKMRAFESLWVKYRKDPEDLIGRRRILDFLRSIEA